MHLRRALAAPIAGVALLVAACTSPAQGPLATESPSPTSTPTSTPAPTPLTASELYELQRSGVVRISATTCQGVAQGTGFFISKQYVATVAHVVEGATALSIRGDNGVLRGTIVGRDRKHDLALVRVEPDSQGNLNTGYRFAFSGNAPRVGDPITIYGYAGGEPISRQPGTLTSSDREIELPFGVIKGLFQQSAPTYPGNSGGPVLNEAGEVVGLVDAVEAYEVLTPGEGSADPVPATIAKVGTAYAIPTSQATAQLSTWAQTPSTVAFESCPWSVSPFLAVKSKHPEAPVLQMLFYYYFHDLATAREATTDAARARDYARAWSLLGREVRDGYGSLDAFVTEHKTSTIGDIVFETALFKDVTHDIAEVSFTTRTDPDPSGAPGTCTRWHNRYTTSITSGTWVIDSVAPIDPPKACG